MARTVGKVKSISGKAAVKTTNDQLHVLKVGEALHENEMVYALGADSKVTLTLEGGRELTLNGYDEILLDKSVFAALEEGEALDVKALQQALAESLNPENMEETAAGQEVVGEANAGAEYADRNDARGNPNSYLTGTQGNALGVTFDALQNENFAPEAFDDSGIAIEEGSGDDYDAPVVAIGNVLENDTDDSLPNPPSDLDVSAVSSNDTANSANYAGGFFIIEGKYGTLVINAETGEYTYTVNDLNADVNALNVGDSLSESFNYVVTDGALTDDAVLRLTINGSNDAPVAVGDRNYVKEAGYHQHPSMAEGNVITDPESGDSDVDNESIWVVGVQKVSGQGGEGEGGRSGGESEGRHSGGEGEGGHNGSEGGYGPGGPHAPTGYDFLVNGKYGVLFMWENGDYVYMLKNGKEQVDSLNEGDRVSETFSYTITDGDKYATAELKISIQGTNDAPVAVADEVSISEDDLQPIWFWHPALTIDALANDTDVDSGDNPSNFNLLSVSVEGGIENGFAWIDQNTDTIKYIPNWWGNQSLNEGDTKNVILNYTMSDDSGVTSTSTVTITIMGENDFAIIYGDDAGKVSEDWHVTSSGKLYESGHLFVSDVDEGEAKFNTNVVTNPNNIGGNLTIDQYGHWTYSIDNSLLQHLNEGAKVYEYFTVTSLDGTDSETIKITITGTNDYATISGDSQGGVTEDVVGAYNKLYDSGKLNVSDVDDGEAKFNTNVIANPHNLGGHLSIDQYGNWNYSINNNLVQYLSAGEKVYEYFTVKSLDGTDSEMIKITITGTNDNATIWGDSRGGVTEDHHVSLSGKLSESGRLYIDDADEGEERFSPQVIADADNIGGQLTISQNGTWNYTINNSLVQHLGAGEKAYEYFTVKSVDGSDSEIIKITITGTNDAPVAQGEAGSTDVIKHITTLSYNLNADNNYTSNGVIITAINGESVDRSGPTMGVDGYHDQSPQMIDPSEWYINKGHLKYDGAEGIQFAFPQTITHALIKFGNFTSEDTAQWAIYNANGMIGTWHTWSNTDNSILPIDYVNGFTKIVIMNGDNDILGSSDSFSIVQVLATGNTVSSVTSGSLLYFSEADLLSNDSDTDHLDTLSIIDVSNTSARGAIITMDDDGNILYNPNDALDSITQMTYDTFNYTISDGHGGTDTATVTVALTPVTTTEAYDGQILLIEGDTTIDLSNIAALSNNFSQIDLKNGDTSLINVSPENVDNVSENGTLTINGDAGDSISLDPSWGGPVTADGYHTYTATVDSNIITLHVDTDIIP